jgi:hypothetical protein
MTAVSNYTSKKQFKKYCDLNHVYGRGLNRTNAIFFDWKETESGRGFKYAVAATIENCTKVELFNHFYNWVCKSISLPYYVRYKVAINDSDRFKTPISLNF